MSDPDPCPHCKEWEASARIAEARLEEALAVLDEVPLDDLPLEMQKQIVAVIQTAER